jgi:limonene-1,2-epoxide hydrolase
MHTPTALSVVRAYHRAWTERDFAELDRLVADPLHVEVPINRYESRAAFLEAVRQTAQMTSMVAVLAELGGDGEAMLLYDMTLPIGELRVAEHFTVSEGRIHTIRQIHDTALLRAAGFGKQQ